MTLSPDAGERDEDRLREYIRALLAARRLPSDAPARTWAGRGTGVTCAACDRTIAATEIEFEMELPSGGDLRLDERCYRVWEEERRLSSGDVS